MDSSMSFDTLVSIDDSWEDVKSIPNWQVAFGDVFFKRLFERAPLSFTLLFPFGTEGERMYDSPEFMECAGECVRTLDFVVASLGPEMDSLVAQLVEMASKHGNVVRRVRPEHWKLVREALLYALEKVGRADRETQKRWALLFETMSETVVKRLEEQ